MFELFYKPEDDDEDILIYEFEDFEGYIADLIEGLCFECLTMGMCSECNCPLHEQEMPLPSLDILIFKGLYTYDDYTGKFVCPSCSLGDSFDEADSEDEEFEENTYD